ncbi:MAG: ATP-binding protein, partial [Phycisphaerae bacterium]|nr:ATP-binding protein [Gemmatimonadaceae bacterium]
ELPLAQRTPGLSAHNPKLVVAGGALWFASTSGIGRMPLAALHAAADRGDSAPTPQIFGEPDGLPTARFSPLGMARIFRARDGRIWFSTPAGLAVVDPKNLPMSREPPPVHVEEVFVDGQLLPRDSLRVPPNSRRVTVHYTASSPRMPERVRLRYRLDGVDPDWVEGGANGAPRSATYTQLRPGRYRFRVQAWNEDGVPSTREAVRAFRVMPAWYQTWWAVALGIAGVAGAGAAASASVGRMRRQRAELAVQATFAERARVARELHDTVLSDMAGVALRLDGIALHAARPASTNGAFPAALVELRDQVRHTLVETRRAVTAMRATTDDFIPLWVQLGDSAGRVFADTDVRVSVEHSGPSRQLAPELRAEVGRIATEALTNAREHGACREVTIACVFETRELRVRVRDDGRGFNPTGAAKDGHFGLAGMRERAAGIGAQLAVESAPGRGTTVLLVVPMRRAT